MNSSRGYKVTLKHLMIKGEKRIGLQYYGNKVLNALVKNLDGVRWCATFNMPHLPHSKSSISLILNTFKGVAWVDGKYFFDKKTKIGQASAISENKVAHWRKRVPPEYLDKLILKRYAENTINSYCSIFGKFLDHYKHLKLNELTEFEIKAYLRKLIEQKKSDSLINQTINAIKFYYEVVLQMPNRFYDLERPLKKEQLPKVISKESIIKMISVTDNIKHKCILALLYSAGMRRSEVIQTKIEDIDSDRMTIRIVNSKGGKDRVTTLSNFLLDILRTYYKEYRPKTYLFEGQKGGIYSAASILKVVKVAGYKAGITQKVTPHMLRHSFATHLLEDGVDLRTIQNLLGHNSLKTTEVYTHVTTNFQLGIKNPLDTLFLKK